MIGGLLYTRFLKLRTCKYTRLRWEDFVLYLLYILGDFKLIIAVLPSGFVYSRQNGSAWVNSRMCIFQRTLDGNEQNQVGDEQFSFMLTCKKHEVTNFVVLGLEGPSSFPSHFNLDGCFLSIHYQLVRNFRSTIFICKIWSNSNFRRIFFQ